MSEVYWYYRLHESEILVQLSDSLIVEKFIESLLILQNILIVNMSILFNAPLKRSNQNIEKSSTVSSPKWDD